MRFKIPKFLERETRLFNLITFKQLAIIGITGMALLILYYVLPRGVFFLIAFITVIVVFSLLFIKVEGIVLSKLIGQFFGYFIGSKKYFWQKREEKRPFRLVKKIEEVPEKKEDEAELKMSPKSKLRDLSSKIDIG